MKESVLTQAWLGFVVISAGTARQMMPKPKMINLPGIQETGQ